VECVQAGTAQFVQHGVRGPGTRRTPWQSTRWPCSSASTGALTPLAVKPGRRSKGCMRAMMPHAQLLARPATFANDGVC